MHCEFAVNMKLAVTTANCPMLVTLNVLSIAHLS